MKIEVKSFMSVITTGRVNQKTLTVPEGTTVCQIMETVGFSPDDEILILVNKGITNENRVLCDGDNLTFMPPVSAA